MSVKIIKSYYNNNIFLWTFGWILQRRQTLLSIPETFLSIGPLDIGPPSSNGFREQPNRTTIFGRWDRWGLLS
jgi:hypothetical protein